MKVGNTIALMVPEKHNFVDKTLGIKHSRQDTAFIFRSALHPLISEGEKIMEGEFCFQCRTPTSSRCAKCGIALYCSKSCQDKHELHRGLCPQMTVLRNLLHMDFAAPPVAALQTCATLACRSACALPRPCPCCGFQDKELGNSDECPGRGLLNHLDYPPAACLPRKSDASQQFYYTPEGVPRRHWALVAEVTQALPDMIVAETKFGEEVCLKTNGSLNTSVWKHGNCIIAFYALLADSKTDEMPELKIQFDEMQALQIQTREGLRELLAAEAEVLAKVPTTTTDARKAWEKGVPSPMTFGKNLLSNLHVHDETVVTYLAYLQVMDCFRDYCSGPWDCHRLTVPWAARSSAAPFQDSVDSVDSAGPTCATREKEVNTQGMEAEKPETCEHLDSPPSPPTPEQEGTLKPRHNRTYTKAEVFADLQALLADYPSGLASSKLPEAFQSRYSRPLKPKAFGFNSWRMWDSETSRHMPCIAAVAPGLQRMRSCGILTYSTGL